MRGLVLAIITYTMATMPYDNWIRMTITVLFGSLAFYTAQHFDAQIMKFLTWYASYRNTVLKNSAENKNK